MTLVLTWSKFRGGRGSVTDSPMPCVCVCVCVCVCACVYVSDGECRLLIVLKSGLYPVPVELYPVPVEASLSPRTP